MPPSQEDIYPDCESNKPALSAADWIAGKNALPLRMSLRDGFTAPAEQAYVAPTPVAKPPAPASAPAPAQPASPVATPAAAAKGPGACLMRLPRAFSIQFICMACSLPPRCT
jgi:coronin-1B/1C/6